MQLTFKIDEKQREIFFKKIWVNEHNDYKGKLSGDGSLSVMGWAKYGFGLQVSTSMSDQELIERAKINNFMVNDKFICFSSSANKWKVFNSTKEASESYKSLTDAIICAASN